MKTLKFQIAAIMLSFLLVGVAVAGPPQDEEAQGKAMLGVAVNGIYQKAITIMALCGSLGSVLTYLELEFGQVPSVLYDFDDDFSAFVAIGTGNRAGTLTLVNPEGEACMILQATNLPVGASISNKVDIKNRGPATSL